MDRVTGRAVKLHPVTTHLASGNLYPSDLIFPLSATRPQEPVPVPVLTPASNLSSFSDQGEPSGSWCQHCLPRIGMRGDVYGKNGPGRMENGNLGVGWTVGGGLGVMAGVGMITKKEN